MSRVAKAPVILPEKVEVSIESDLISVKGPLGSMSQRINSLVSVEKDTGNDNQLIFKPSNNDPKGWSQAGTLRALTQNMVKGVTEGFTTTLELVGVGFRAQAKGKVVGLSLGFSHPIDYQLREGVTAEVPNNTTIVLKSIDKQKLGQVAAEIRELRPPEPYKGKGVRYSTEVVKRKETKKK